MTTTATPEGTSSPAAPAATPATPASPATITDPIARRAAVRAAVMSGAAAAKPAPAPAASPPSGQPASATPADPAAIATAPAADPAPGPSAAPGPLPGQPAEPTEPPGMAAVRKAEIHMRRQIATERAQLHADFDSQRAVWQQRVDKATQLEQLITNARTNPIAVLGALGFSEADWEPLAHMIFTHSPAGAKDPARRQAAAAALREREATGRLDRTERELQELKRGLTEREQQAQQVAQAQANIGRWLGVVTGAIGDRTPLAKAATAQPEQLNQRLIAITDRLWQESGPTDDLREMPEPADVLTIYEAERAAELEATRAEYEALTRRTAAPSSTPAAAPTAAAAPAATPAAPTAPPPTTEPPRKLSRAELLEGIRRQRAAMT